MSRPRPFSGHSCQFVAGNGVRPVSGVAALDHPDGSDDDTSDDHLQSPVDICDVHQIGQTSARSHNLA
jgi:hypothetical protein